VSIESFWSVVLHFLAEGLTGAAWWQALLVALLFTHLTIASVTLYLHRHSAHRALDLHQAQVQQVRQQHPGLAQMHAMREELRPLWSHSARSREQLAQDLHAWCQRAEASGIAALQEFSQRVRALRSVAAQPVSA